MSADTVPAVQRALAQVAAGAAARDREPAFPFDAMTVLAQAGALGRCGSISQEWELVRAVAQADGSVARGRVAPARGGYGARVSHARITPYRDGPLIVRGPFVLADQDGNDIAVGRRTVALCRCGKSRIRPFCDGTHKTIRFSAPSGAEDRVVGSG